MKQAIVEITRTYIVEYDRLSALADFCDGTHPGGGFSVSPAGHWNARLSDEPPVYTVRSKRKPKVKVVK